MGTAPKALSQRNVRRRVGGKHVKMGPRRLWVRAAVIVITLTFAFPGAGRSQTETHENPETLIKKGNELRSRGQDLEAFTYFQRAFEIAPSPRTTGQLGLVEFALRRWVEAEVHISRALAAADDAWIRRHRNTFVAALATVRTHLGDLEITGSPEGATVLVGSQVVGSLPLMRTIRVAEGDATVRVRAPGYLPYNRVISIKPGETTRLAVFLETERRRESINIPSPSASLVTASSGGTAGSSLNPTRVAGTALLVGGAVATAAGIGLLVLDGEPTCNAKPGRVCRERFSTKLGGWSLVGTGTLSGLLGGVLFLRRASLSTKIDRTSMYFGLGGAL